jgi:hypothetical protein
MDQSETERAPPSTQAPSTVSHCYRFSWHHLMQHRSAHSGPMRHANTLKALFYNDLPVVASGEVLSSQQTRDNAPGSTEKDMSVSMARDFQPTTGTGNRIHPRAKALMILIAVVTLIAIWLVPADKKEPPLALPELASPPQVEEPAVPLPLPPVSQDEITAEHREGDRARAIVAKLRAENRESDTGEIFAQAEQLQSEGQLDDAYLLYRLAARQGDAQAALLLGTQADPAFYKSETSVLPGPDLQQSYKWYRAAAAAGNDEAVARLQKLREHVEQSAVAGDVAAQRLMLQWQ